MTTTKNILVISDVNIPGAFATGGALRSTRSIMEYSKYFDVDLIMPRALDIPENKLKGLIHDLGVREIVGFSIRNKVIKLLHERYPALLYIGLPAFTRGLFIKVNSPSRVPNAIIVLNEPMSHIVLGKLLKDRYNAPSMILFQLPTFYYDKKRREHVYYALKS